MKKRYEIGDKVKLSPDSEYYGDDRQGDDTIGEIVDFEYELPTNDDYIDQEEYYYKVKWGNHDVNYYRYIDLMPAEEKKSLKQPASQQLSTEKEWKPKFKIGDRVQIIKASHGWGYVEHGDIGIVVYVPTRKDHSYAVNFDKCKYWTSTEECFILEEAAPKDKSAEGEFVYSPPMVRIITTNGISSKFKNEQSINLLIHKPKKFKYLKLN
jgi:hypothetical protein